MPRKDKADRRIDPPQKSGKRAPAPVPRTREEARAQIKQLVKENKAFLDALAKM